MQFSREELDRRLLETASIETRIQLVDSPLYQACFEHTLEQSQLFLQGNLSHRDTGLIIIDVDETTLDNRGFYAHPEVQYYEVGHPEQYVRVWHGWCQEANAPVIPPTQRWLDWVQQQGFQYGFVTGRRHKHHEWTWQNLERAGAITAQCVGLFCRPDDWTASTAEFKTHQYGLIEQMVEKKIVAILGDQPGDMGWDCEGKFLLPSFVLHTV